MLELEIDDKMENWAGVLFATVRKEIKDEKVVSTIVRAVMEYDLDSISDMILRAKIYTLNYLKCGKLSH